MNQYDIGDMIKYSVFSRAFQEKSSHFGSIKDIDDFNSCVILEDGSKVKYGDIQEICWKKSDKSKEKTR